MWQISPKETLKTCKSIINCNHLSWLDIYTYLLKKLPFSIVAGLTIGLIASLFDICVVNLNRVLVSSETFIKLFPIVVAVITGLLIAKDQSVAGAGISYVLNHMRKAVPIPTLIKKFVLSVLALSGVFIAGREGPSFFIGSSISLYLSKLFKLTTQQKRDIALIGAGAFTSALLKAPLGGAIFALEIGYVSDMEYELFPEVLVASIMSYMVYSSLRGVHSLMNLKGLYIGWQLHTIPILMLMGVAAAIIAYAFINLFHFSSCLISFIKPIARPVLGTLLALPFIIILLSNDHLGILSVSVNYNALTNIAKIHLPLIKAMAYMASVMLVVSFAIGSGISGGLILPSLLIGALLGNAFSTIFLENQTLFVLSGMAAFLASVAKTPLAAIVLVLELSQTDLIIPLTASVVVSYVLTYGVSIYEAQKKCRI